MTTEPLGGLSGRDVVRAAGPRGVVVVKHPAHAREVSFYREVAEALDPGVAVPRALLAQDGWLVLEHLPEPLPRERWLADPSVMRALAAVHRSHAAAGLLDDPFRPVWTPDVTDAALARVATTQREATRRSLERLRSEAVHWLDGDVLVSADPNPLNWGVREDGILVLFDWERVGLATPAVDVAITVPGLPRRDQVELAAAAYLAVQDRDHVAWSPSQLTRGLLVVKAWTCVELLAQDPRDDAPDDRLGEVQRWLAADLPAWVTALP